MPTIHCKTTYIDEDVIISKGSYDNGRLAIMLHDPETFEPIAKVTVNIPEIYLRDDEIIVKDYSENEGMSDWLIENDLIIKTSQHLSVFMLTNKFKKMLGI